MNKGSILLIEDEERLRGLLHRILTLEGYKVAQAGNLHTAFKQFEHETPEVVITDVKLPDGNGIDFLRKIKARDELTEVILLTAYGTIEDGVNAMKLGAFDYITKGEGEEQILPTVSKAMDKVKLKEKIHRLEKKISDRYSIDNILGKSPSILQAKQMAAKVASTDTTVLLLGETGTGKEVFAQAIHQSSPRRDHSFVAINCSAIGKDILETELFGYKAGAFTGANKDKKGLFEEATEGTIFLDEIGEMPLELQAKLLRILETQSFIKPGETKTTQVNVRVIAATNKELLKESEEGKFRLDLYYRLATFSITLPPLRERPDDLEELCQHLIRMVSAKSKNKISGMSSEFLNQLKNYQFKGNIRELKNILERAVILTDTEELSAELLPPEVLLSQHTGKSPYNLSNVEQLYIRKVLVLTQGNKSKAAELLGIGLTTLYRKLEEYKIVL